MKVSRSYLLGLGSGLILSAMLILLFPPLQGQAVIPQVQAPPTNTGTPKQPTLPQAKNGNQAVPSETPSPTPTEKSFTIPKGASAQKIADLLVAQGFIKDQASFLESAHQLGVERQFRARTLNLSLGLSPAELIQRLLEK